MKDYLSNGFDFSAYADLADECSIWSAPFGLKLLEYINYKKGITAVDIGSGTGFPLTEIALRLGSGATVYGIDPWAEANERANKKIRYYRLSNVKIIKGYAESIPLEKGSVDLIVSNNGLNNVKDLEKAICECSRILRPGGQFIQTMNLDKTMFEFYSQLECVLSSLAMEKEINLMYQHIYEKRRPLEELISILSSYGFTIRDMEQDQFDYRFSDGTAMLNHYFIRLAFMDSWIKILPPDMLEEIFDRVEQGLNEQASRLGSLKLSIPFVLINATK